MGLLDQLRKQQAGVAKVVDADGVTRAVEEKVVEIRKVTAPVVEIVGEGFCRILPPGVNSFAELGSDWVLMNWGDKTPSPWQRVEGLPDHPEFEKNLEIFEKELSI